MSCDYDCPVSNRWLFVILMMHIGKMEIIFFGEDAYLPIHAPVICCVNVKFWLD